MGHEHTDIRKQVRIYIGVFVALGVLTVLTVAASYVHASAGAHIAIALVIAAIKASLVAAIFMHLKWERGVSIWWTLLFCAIFFTALMMLPVLTAQGLSPGIQEGTWG